MNETFAERLKRLRGQNKLSQVDLAKAIDVHPNHYGRYERGLSQPSTDSLKLLADALAVSADYLLEGSTDDAAKADFEDRDLLRMFKEVEQFDDDDKAVIKKLLDAFIMKKKIQKMAVQ